MRKLVKTNLGAKYLNCAQINNLTTNYVQITQTSSSAEIGCKLCTNYLNCAQINSLTTNCGQITQTTNCGLGLRVKGLGFRVYGLRI